MRLDHLLSREKREGEPERRPKVDRVRGRTDRGTCYGAFHLEEADKNSKRKRVRMPKAGRT